MSMTKSLSFLLCVPSIALLAADRKAAITPAQTAGVSIAAPVIGSFLSSDGFFIIEGVPGAAHALRSACVDCLVPLSAVRRGPETLRNITLPADVSHVFTFAISDDSSRTLIATESGVYERAAASWRLVTADAVTALAFIPKRSDALLATRDQLYILKDGALRVLTTEGIVSPLDIAAANDGRSAIVLNSGGTNVRVIDLATSAARSLTLGSAAAHILRGSDSVFIFVPKQGASPWLLDMSTGQLSFAPELPGNNASGPVLTRAR